MSIFRPHWYAWLKRIKVGGTFREQPTGTYNCMLVFWTGVFLPKRFLVGRCSVLECRRRRLATSQWLGFLRFLPLGAQPFVCVSATCMRPFAILSPSSRHTHTRLAASPRHLHSCGLGPDGCGPIYDDGASPCYNTGEVACQQRRGAVSPVSNVRQRPRCVSATATLCTSAPCAVLVVSAW